MKDGESLWYTVPTFPEAVLSFEEEYSSFLDRVEQVHRIMIRRGNWAQSQADENSAREDDNMGELTLHYLNQILIIYSTGVSLSSYLAVSSARKGNKSSAF